MTPRGLLGAGTIGTKGSGIGVGRPDDQQTDLLANLHDRSFGSLQPVFESDIGRADRFAWDVVSMRCL